MEIERKFLLKDVPKGLSQYPCHLIEQGYLSKAPVVRVRREDDRFYMTYKNGKIMAHEEYNLPLTQESYEHLVQKADGIIITKKRYCIPLRDFFEKEETFRAEWEELVVEYDVFSGIYEGITLAEIEFPTVEMAEGFLMPSAFWKDVTYDSRYHNSQMSEGNVFSEVFADEEKN